MTQERIRGHLGDFNVAEIADCQIIGLGEKHDVIAIRARAEHVVRFLRCTFDEHLIGLPDSRLVEVF